VIDEIAVDIDPAAIAAQSKLTAIGIGGEDNVVAQRAG